MWRLNLIIGIILISAISIVYAENNTPEFLYQKALYLETGKADYEGAIKIYGEIVKEHAKNAEFVAKALYRMGICHEKLGNAEQAFNVFEELVNKYPESEFAKISKEYSLEGKLENCVNNLKQIGLALHMYAQDNDNKFPEELSELYPQYASIDIFVCPFSNTKVEGKNDIDENTDYVYKRGLTALSDPDGEIVWDKEGNHGKAVPNVLHVDGYVGKGLTYKKMKDTVALTQDIPLNLDPDLSTKAKIENILKSFDIQEAYTSNNAWVKQIVGFGREAIPILLEIKINPHRWAANSAIEESLEQLLTEEDKDIILKEFKGKERFANLIKKYKFAEAKEIIIEKLKQEKPYYHAEFIDAALAFDMPEWHPYILRYFETGMNKQWTIESLEKMGIEIPDSSLITASENATRHEYVRLAEAMLKRRMKEGLKLCVLSLQTFNEKGGEHYKDKARKLIFTFTTLSGSDGYLSMQIQSNFDNISWDKENRVFIIAEKNNELVDEAKAIEVLKNHQSTYNKFEDFTASIKEISTTRVKEGKICWKASGEYLKEYDVYIEDKKRTKLEYPEMEVCDGSKIYSYDPVLQRVTKESLTFPKMFKKLMMNKGSGFLFVKNEGASDVAVINPCLIGPFARKGEIKFFILSVDEKLDKNKQYEIGIDESGEYEAMKDLLISRVAQDSKFKKDIEREKDQLRKEMKDELLQDEKDEILSKEEREKMLKEKEAYLKTLDSEYIAEETAKGIVGKLTKVWIEDGTWLLRKKEIYKDGKFVYRVSIDNIHIDSGLSNDIFKKKIKEVKLLKKAKLETKEKPEDSEVLQCQLNLKQIWLAIEIWQQGHDGRFPSPVSALYSVISDLNIFVCPACKNVSITSKDQIDIMTSYLYISEGHYKGESLTDIIAFDKEENHSGMGRNVLFADGSIKWMTEETFKKALDSVDN